MLGGNFLQVKKDMEIKDCFVLGHDQEQSHLNVRTSSANAKSGAHFGHFDLSPRLYSRVV